MQDFALIRIEADVALEQGDAALEESNFQLAQHAFDQARRLYGQIDDTPAELNCLEGVIEAAYQLADYEAVQVALEDARKLYHRLGDLPGEADCVFRYGSIAVRSDLEAYNTAPTAFEDARRLYRELGDLKGEADCFHGLGQAAVQYYDEDAACKAFTSARRLYRKLHDAPGEAACIQGFGEAALRCGDHYGEAQKYFRQALPLYQRLGDISAEADCYFGIGEAALRDFDYAMAKQALGEALRLYKQIGAKAGETDCINYIKYTEAIEDPSRKANENAKNDYRIFSSRELKKYATDFTNISLFPFLKNEKRRYRKKYNTGSPSPKPAAASQIRMEDDSIRREAESSADRLHIPVAAREDFIERFVTAAIVALTPSLPSKPSEQYMPRGTENIVAFLRRVWGSWVRPKTPAVISALGDQLLSRAKLSELDPRAAKAVVNWLRSNPLPDDIFLPTPEQINDALTADERAVRLAGRVVSASRRRAWRSTRPSTRSASPGLVLKR